MTRLPAPPPVVAFAERPRRRSDPRHISVLESRPNGHHDDGHESDDVASLAFLSVTQQSPSDVSSVNLYYGDAGDDDVGGSVAHSNRARGSSALRSTSRRRSTLIAGGDATTATAKLFSHKRLGLVVSVAAVGAVHGLLQSAAYPFFKLYLNADEYQAYAAERWLVLPWLLKPALALLTDAAPIRGRRRQPYLLLGWAWCLLFAFIAALLPAEQPYARDGQVVNEHAPDARTKFAALLTLATFGYVLVDAACDGVMVQLGQPARGVVATLQAARFGAQMLATLLVALLCNSSEFGGAFAWSVSIRGVAVLVLVVSAAAGVCAQLFFVDESTELMLLDAKEERSLWQHVSAVSDVLWCYVQKRAVWQTMAFTFVSRVGFSYYATSAKAVYEFWLDMSPLASGIFSAVNCSVYAGVALLFLRSQNVQALSWKKVVVVAAVGSVFVTLVSALFTVFGVVRSAFLTLVFEQLGSGFDALAYFVVLFVAVHVAEPGFESFSYNAVVAAGNLGVPFAVSLSQSVGAHFDVYDDEYTRDTAHARSQAMLCFVVALVVKLASLAALPLLPHGAQHACELKDAGGSKRLAGIAASAVTGFLFFWALLMILLASFERTACLTVAGGEGC